jgi:hypothetical protein
LPAREKEAATVWVELDLEPLLIGIRTTTVAWEGEPRAAVVERAD